MPTVLRISGPHKQLQRSLLSVPLPFTESAASRRNRERSDLLNDGVSTFNFTISDADGDQVSVQVDESVAFVSQNVDVIEECRRLPGVESLCLDFSWEIPSTSVGQSNRFPSSFLKTCAMLGLDIEVSVYLVEGGGLPRKVDTAL